MQITKNQTQAPQPVTSTKEYLQQAVQRLNDRLKNMGMLIWQDDKAHMINTVAPDKECGVPLNLDQDSIKQLMAKSDKDLELFLKY